MVRVDEEAEIPEAGAVFTFGKSRFAENVPSKFWFRNDIVTQLDSGDEHTLVATANGRVYAFGTNEWGQLGLGTTRNVSKPTCIKALKHEKVKCIGAGRSHSVVYTGHLYTFGANGEGQLGLGDTSDHHEPCILDGFSNEVRAVAAGSYHSAILTVDGKLYTFGCNNQGQLGLGEGVDKVFLPTQVQIDAPVTFISCGYYHTAFVANGKLYTCGEKEGGKLGLLEKQLSRGTALPQCIFSIVERVASVSCGGNHTALLTECGKLYTFGSGLNGQLGLGTMVMETGAPSLVGAFDAQTVSDVSCGESHTAIIIGEGQLLTCGDGRHGKLGLGNNNFSNQFNPIMLKNFHQYFVHQVSCGGCHMVVLATKRAADDPILLTASDGEISAHELSSPLVMEAAGEGFGLTARGRRREKEMQGKSLLPINQSLPPLLNLDSKIDSLGNANDDLDPLQQELMEIDTRDGSQPSVGDNHDDNVAGGADGGISVLGVSQFNKTHLLLVDETHSVAELVPTEQSSVVGELMLEKQLTITGNEKENCEKSVDSSGSDTESELEKEVTVEKDDNRDKEMNASETTIDDHGEEKGEQAPRKESFLKKIFSFKKKKSASKPNKSESVTTDVTTEAKKITPPVIISQSLHAEESLTAEPQDRINDVQDRTKVVSMKDEQTDASGSKKDKMPSRNEPNEPTSKACTIL